jgi:predicted Zn-dependent protease
MSWFDATGFANLAKSALKEAQKTIDKALDIKDEESQSKTSSPISPQDDTDNFFASWGLKSSGEKEVADMSNELLKVESSCSTDTEQESHKEVSVGINRMTMSTSLWGSFTGSFFENPRSNTGEF